jgi:hypothetical protein
MGVDCVAEFGGEREEGWAWCGGFVGSVGAGRFKDSDVVGKAVAGDGVDVLPLRWE